jgi:pimeloyl-ACP methyl ester carboxylesterase
MSVILISSLIGALNALASPVQIGECRAAFDLTTAPVRETFQETKITLAFPSERNRVISVEVVPPASPDRPLFLLMPGIHRSGRLNDPSSLALIKKGFGVAEVDFSAHPFSIVQLGKGESPSFRRRSPSLQDLANEIDFVAAELTKRFGAQNLIPVSLSYSGAVSPLIQSRALIIETVPMTSERAVNPEGAAFRDQLRAGEVFNPIFGPTISRNILDQAYRSRWSQQTDAIIQSFGLSRDRRTDIIEGYSALSRASEDAAWKGKALNNAGHRAFILAEGENQKLLVDQLETVKALLVEGKSVSLFVVENSGHIIPVEQPEIYAQLLATIAEAHSAKTLANGVTRIRNDGSREFIPAGPPTLAWLEATLQAVKDRPH